MSVELVLDWLTTPEAEFAVCRLDPDTPLPAWGEPREPSSDVRFIGVTRTAVECSIVAPASVVPPDIRAERGWAGLQVAGPLDFGLTGVIARLAGALAAAEVSVFVISTFDTDILLVKHAALEDAIAALATVADVGRLAPRSRGSAPG